MCSQLLPRHVCFAISDLTCHRTSSTFLFPTTLLGYAAEEWPSNYILPILRKKITFYRAFSAPPPSSLWSPNGGEEGNGNGNGNLVARATEALRHYLEQEAGVSREESLDISSNCPNYLNMLIQSVGDLHQLSSSSALPFWSQNDQLSFASNVYEMAKQKGDKGMLPFLESVGLTLSSASHLATYLSSHTLPTLIHQVFYLFI